MECETNWPHLHKDIITKIVKFLR